MGKLLDTIDGILNQIVSGKNVKPQKKLNQIFDTAYDKKKYGLILDNIRFGKIQGYADVEYNAFYFREVPETISIYYFDNIEYNENVEIFLAEQTKIPREKIESINRVITGILLGVECRQTSGRYIFRNYFNHYLQQLQKSIPVERQPYDEKVFATRFLQQTADTEQNRKAIGDICYAYSETDHRWGIRLTETMHLLRDIIQQYAAPEVYNLANKDSEVKISYQSFAGMILLIETLLMEFELPE